MDTMLSKISKFQRRMKNIFDPFEGKRPRVLLLGLDGAGKTTLLYKAKLDDTIYANVPPRGINIEHMTPRRGASIQIYDMTGNKVARLMWQQWFRGVEGLVYVVDSSDKVRMDEAKFELHEILKSRDIRRVPLVVVANKQDAEESMSTEDIKRELDLDSINDRDWSVYGTSATNGTGIVRVFKDAVDKIKAFRHYKSSLTMKPDSRRSSKKSMRSEKSDAETKSVSNCSSIEEPVKVKSLFDSISEDKEITDGGRKDVDEASYGDSEKNSDASAKYDVINMGNEENDSDAAVNGKTATEAEVTEAHMNDSGSVGDDSESPVEQGPSSEEDNGEAYENKTYDTLTGTENIEDTEVEKSEEGVCY